MSHSHFGLQHRIHCFSLTNWKEHGICQKQFLHNFFFLIVISETLPEVFCVYAIIVLVVMKEEWAVLFSSRIRT